MEPAKAAGIIGLPDCRVSMPLTRTEVVESAIREGNSRVEESEEWRKIESNLQPGDELRLVDCKQGDVYFYALFRDGKPILRYHSMIVD